MEISQIAGVVARVEGLGGRMSEAGRQPFQMTRLLGRCWSTLIAKISMRT